MSAPPPQSHERYERIFAEVEAPFAFVDLDAMWANADGDAGAGRRASRSGSPASRSAAGRCWSGSCAATSASRGLMTFTLPETLWLAEQGFEDLLLAYPTADAGALEELALRSAAQPGAGADRDGRLRRAPRR